MGAAETAQSDGEKKPAAAAAAGGGGGGSEKKDDTTAISVYKMDMHCKGCAKKIRGVIKQLQGVEAVKTDCEVNKLTVTGKVDPAKVKARIEEKTKKRVEIISPLNKKDTVDKKSGEKTAESPAEKKTADKKKLSQQSTVVMKVRTHCGDCVAKMHKIIFKIKGVDNVTVDAQKDLITVNGTMDVNTMIPYLISKLKRTVQVVPPKTDFAAGDRKIEEEGGGSSKTDTPATAPSPPFDNGAKVEVNKLDYHPTPSPTHWFSGDFGPSYVVEPAHHYGYYPVNHGYALMNHGYVQPMHAPEMFSDENPNACSVM